MTDLDRLGRGSGVAFPVISIGAILLATLGSSTFSWTGCALSNLGEPGEPTALVFNGGLVLTGIVALPFVAWLYVRSRNRLERVGALVLGLSAALSVLVGVFPISTDPHFPVAVGFFVSVSVALWVRAAGAYRAGRPRDAVVAFACGSVDPLGWVVWGLAGQGVAPGLAIPEFVAVLGLHAWVLYTVLSSR